MNDLGLRSWAKDKNHYYNKDNEEIEGNMPAMVPGHDSNNC